MRTSMRRSMFTAGFPRNPRSSFQDLSDSIARRASVSFNGGKASARSWKTSVAVPPIPTKITAPKTGSFFMPTIISKALGMATIFCTVTPRIVASGRFALARSVISLKAAATAWSEARLSTTPPTSVLCVICGESIFITTG